MVRFRQKCLLFCDSNSQQNIFFFHLAGDLVTTALLCDNCENLRQFSCQWCHNSIPLGTADLLCDTVRDASHAWWHSCVRYETNVLLYDDTVILWEKLVLGDIIAVSHREQLSCSVITLWYCVTLAMPEVIVIHRKTLAILSDIKTVSHWEKKKKRFGA